MKVNARTAYAAMAMLIAFVFIDVTASAVAQNSQNRDYDLLKTMSGPAIAPHEYMPSPTEVRNGKRMLPYFSDEVPVIPTYETQKKKTVHRHHARKKITVKKPNTINGRSNMQPTTESTDQFFTKNM